MTQDTWGTASRFAAAVEKLMKEEKREIEEIAVNRSTDGRKIVAMFTVKDSAEDADNSKLTEKIVKTAKEAAEETQYELQDVDGRLPALQRGMSYIRVAYTRQQEKVEIITKKSYELTWERIDRIIWQGDAKEILHVGDKIPFKMKDGTDVVAVAAHVMDDMVYFVTEDAALRSSMYEKFPDDDAALTWEQSDLRRKLNEEVFGKLPVSLQAAITVRTIQQRIGERTVKTRDKLWIPSYTELFGRTGGEAYETDGEDEFHFDLFPDERSRVKQWEKETDWYWTRTPAPADSSTHFRCVSSNGYTYSGGATYTYSVSFGFCIGRIRAARIN